MKKTIPIAILLVAFTGIAQAQCDKKTKWTSAKTIFLDSAMKVVKTDVETVIIELGKDDVTIIPHGSEDEMMKGVILTKTCNWTETDKNGKTVFRSELADGHGDIKHTTVTIQAVNGEISILLEADEVPVKIRLEGVKVENLM